VSGGRFEELSRAHERTKADLARATRELRELIGIGVRLAAERDTDSLLDLLLTTAREITWSDAGSLYLVDTDATGTRCLRSALVQNDSLSVAVKEHVIQIGPQSVPGYAAQSGEVINLADTYAPYAGLPFTVDRTLDQETGYRTKSMLVVPMKTPKGEVLGVLQLMNRRSERDYLPNQLTRGYVRSDVGTGLRIYLNNIVLPLLGLDFGYGIEGHSPQIYFEVGLTDF